MHDMHLCFPISLRNLFPHSRTHPQSALLTNRLQLNHITIFFVYSLWFQCHRSNLELSGFDLQKSFSLKSRSRFRAASPKSAKEKFLADSGQLATSGSSLRLSLVAEEGAVALLLQTAIYWLSLETTGLRFVELCCDCNRLGGAVAAAGAAVPLIPTALLSTGGAQTTKRQEPQATGHQKSSKLGICCAGPWLADLPSLLDPSCSKKGFCLRQGFCSQHCL